MKSVDIRSNDSSKEINNKNAKFKLVVLLEIENIKIFLQKVTLQIGLKKFFWLKKLKKTVTWTYAVNYVNGEDIKKNQIKQIKKEFRIKKVTKKRQ